MSNEERSTIVESLRQRPPEERAAILIACALHMLKDLSASRRKVIWVLRWAFRLVTGQGKQVDPWTWAQERIRLGAQGEVAQEALQPATPDHKDEPPLKGQGEIT